MWDPARGTYKVFDPYDCTTCSLSSWGDGGEGGGFRNHRTAGTVARFSDSAGTVVHPSTAPDVAPSWWGWDPVWTIGNR
ncbi:hypothetical protein [Streptomyces sp. NRRL F-5727]|uniref:hypothetical protein n=1 Tax=Streptomyces sp. NRRL F-5727 TaxID=1463871 RepID=UPI0004CB1130|nr:hypothetical protein [Streptomyces sp. NRRL F-5727]